MIKLSNDLLISTDKKKFRSNSVELLDSIFFNLKKKVIRTGRDREKKEDQFARNELKSEFSRKSTEKLN